METSKFHSRIIALQQEIEKLKARAEIPESTIQMCVDIITELAEITTVNWHNVIEESHDGVVILNQHGHILFSNAVGCKLFNLSDSSSNKNFGVPIVSSEPQEVNIMQYEKGQMSIAEMIVRKISWENKPAYLLKLHDVTAYKRVEEDLQKSRDFIEEINQLLPSIIYVYDVIDKKPSMLTTNSVITSVT
jgi:PAS domain-containing protein